MQTIHLINLSLQNLIQTSDNPHTQEGLGRAFLRFFSDDWHIEENTFWKMLKPLVPDEKADTAQTVTLDDIIKKVNTYFTQHSHSFDRNNSLIIDLSAFFSAYPAHLFKLHRGLQHKLTIIDPWADTASHALSNLKQLEFHHTHHETAWFSLPAREAKYDAPTQVDIDAAINEAILTFKKNMAHETSYQLLHTFSAFIPDHECAELIALLLTHLQTPKKYVFDTKSMHRHNKRILDTIKALLQRLPENQRSESLATCILRLEELPSTLLPVLRQFEAYLTVPQCTAILTQLLPKGHARQILPFKRGLTADLLTTIRTEHAAIHQRLQNKERETVPFCPYSRYVYLTRFLPTDEQDAAAVDSQRYANIMTEKSLATLSDKHSVNCSYNDAIDQMEWFSPVWLNCSVVQDLIPETTQAGIIAGLLNTLPSPMVPTVKIEHLMGCLALMHFKDFFPGGDFDAAAHALTIQGKPFADATPASRTIDVEQKKQFIVNLMLRYLDQDLRYAGKITDWHYYSPNPIHLHDNPFVKATLETFHAENDFIPQNMHMIIRAKLVSTLKSPHNREQETAAHVLLSWTNRLSLDECSALLLDLTALAENKNHMNVHHALVFLQIYHRQRKLVTALQQTPEAKWQQANPAIAARYILDDKEENQRLLHSVTFCQSLFRRRKPMAELKVMQTEMAEAKERIRERDECNTCKEPLLDLLSQIKEKIMDDKLGEANLLLNGLYRSAEKEKLGRRDTIAVPGEIDQVRYQLKKI